MTRTSGGSRETGARRGTDALRAAVPRLLAALRYGVAWLPLVLVYMLAVNASRPLPLEVLVGAAVRTVGIAALLGLVVRAVVRRDPWPSRLGAAFVARHVAWGIAYGLAWTALIGLSLVQATGSVAGARREMAPWWHWQVFEGVLVYATLAGITWATEAARRSREREALLVEAEALRAKAELGALRGQLDPHFLFNTLHTVAVLTRHDPAVAATALERLAELLRYVLDAQRGARDDVPLEDELAFVDAYLALEALRLGDRLRVVRELSPEALGRRIPSLALQPLVENALRYGIAPRADGGTLRLGGRVEGGTLVLEVDDDGPGAAALTPPRGTGVGLDTLRKRLLARYGDAAALDVRTAPGAGFHVTVRVPA